MRLLKLTLDGNKKPIKDKSWISTKDINEVTIKECLDANLRDLFDDEIVLDCENKLQTNIVRKKLISEKYGYSEWSTGSRGTHFHLTIDGLKALTEKERILYRLKVITYFGTDPAKKSGFIAMENRPHFKTGLMKQKVAVVDNKNKVNIDYIVRIKEILSKSKTLNISKFDDSLKQKLRQKWSVSDVLRKYSIDTTSKLTMCPLGHPSDGKKCLHYENDKGLWYCFHCGTGGDIFTLVMLKEDVGFKEAINIIGGW